MGKKGAELGMRRGREKGEKRHEGRDAERARERERQRERGRERGRDREGEREGERGGGRGRECSWPLRPSRCKVSSARAIREVSIWKYADQVFQSLTAAPRSNVDNDTNNDNIIIIIIISIIILYMHGTRRLKNLRPARSFFVRVLKILQIYITNTNSSDNNNTSNDDYY